MLVRVRLVAFTLCWIAACGLGPAQTRCLAIPGKLPCIDKIDPPNWWTNMPSPMLLLYGNHLENSQVAVTGGDISVSRSQSSANGHYLFIWLDTANTAPQQITLRITNPAGSGTTPFALSARKPASAGFQGFSSRDVMYLIMTDRFADGDTSNDPNPTQRDLPRGWHGGDFRGIEERLDYLKQLGVTTIWTTPVYNNTGSPDAYHGYSATDMYSVDPHFGTLADYQHLANAIHAAGMKIVLDTVPNHVGPAHPWAKDPPTPDWFHGTVAHHDPAQSDFGSIPDPHASWAEQKDVTQGWFANVLPDLNQENPLVSQYLIQNAIWWIETAGLDGLRLDTFPYVGRAFWHDFDAELLHLYPNLTAVGEIFNADPTITSYFAGGVARNGPDGDIDTGLCTPFDFPTFFMLRRVLTQNQPMRNLEEVLLQDRLYPHPERLVPFLGNHDTVRFMSAPGATIDDLKIAFALLATLRGMPQVYSGDEIAMRGGADPDNRRDFPGGFPGDPANAFTAAGRTPEQQDVFRHASSLFHFRAEHPTLQTGQQQDIFMDNTVFAFVRGADIQHGCMPSNQGEERVLVVANHATVPRTLTIPQPDTTLAGCTRFTPVLGSPGAVSTDNSVSMRLAPDQVGIYLVH
jgi:neopullulanase